ncbi:MAG: RNA 2'-phosphotransferase [Saprospiraceae bacterium]|nr:RNA 2'-phosphotransferase [Lewinella sp.]
MKTTQPNLVQLGKFLSMVLRHRPEVIDIQPDPQGWVDIDVLLTQCHTHGKPIDRPILEAIVATNNKKRYTISEDGRRIRAHQGHSIPVELGYEPIMPPNILYHGTAVQHVEGILQKGLLRQKRHHVHLSADQQTAEKVGIRHGRLAMFHVDAGRMQVDGHVFFCSPNGVWLTDHVPADYLKLV